MTDDLTKRIADLERELRELKAQLPPSPVEPYKPKKPMPKYDPTEGFRLPASAVKAMCDVVPDMRGIAQEQKQVSAPGTVKPEKPVERGSGWGRSVPLGPPSGLKYVDQLVDAQDALDKRELERKLKGGG